MFRWECTPWNPAGSGSGRTQHPLVNAGQTFAQARSLPLYHDHLRIPREWITKQTLDNGTDIGVIVHAQ